MRIKERRKSENHRGVEVREKIKYGMTFFYIKKKKKKYEIQFPYRTKD